MKELFVVANWKSNKTTSEAKEWFQKISNIQYPISNNKTVIVCPPFTSLPLVKELIVNDKLPMFAGAQNISPFEMGAHTGEVDAEQVKEFADYTIIGHSERRQDFGETDEVLIKKVEIALKFGIKPIFCVQGKETPIPEGVEVVAYEPVFAIGTGHPDTPENAEEVIKSIKENSSYVKSVLYGGSVNAEDVRSFTQMPSIDGVLVGGASLDVEHFMQIIENA